MTATFTWEDFEIFVNRTVEYQFKMFESDGETKAVLDPNDVVRFKLWQTDGAAPNLDIDSAGPFSATFTADAGTEFLTSAAHGLEDGQIVRVTTTTTLPNPLAINTNYYVISKTDDTFQLSLTLGGAAIDLTDVGTGTHTWEVQKSKVTVDNVGVPNTTPATVTVRFHQNDTAGLTAGEYSGELAIVDDDDNDTIKPAGRGVVNLEGSALGEIGLT